MDPSVIRIIISRTITILLLIVVALYAIGFMKKRQRQNAIVSELKSLSSDSSFFGQFTAADAEKSLIRAVGLIAGAKKLGMEPERAIKRGLGIEEKYFAMDDEDDRPTIRQTIIIRTLRSNYENFRKLGYEADFHTLESMGKGELPPIRKGPRAGKRAVVGTIVDPALSPGLDTVMANLEIRPPDTEKDDPMTDVGIAAARALVIDLADADVIEGIAEQRILKDLAERADGTGTPEDEAAPDE